jgi:hypothetical protein
MLAVITVKWRLYYKHVSYIKLFISLTCADSLLDQGMLWFTCYSIFSHTSLLFKLSGFFVVITNSRTRFFPHEPSPVLSLRSIEKIPASHYLVVLTYCNGLGWLGSLVEELGEVVRGFGCHSGCFFFASEFLISSKWTKWFDANFELNIKWKIKL